MKWTCLKDNPELSKEIKSVIHDLKEIVKDNTKMHLADVGLLLSIKSKTLKDLSETSFALHEKQKQ